MRAPDSFLPGGRTSDNVTAPLFEIPLMAIVSRWLAVAACLLPVVIPAHAVEVTRTDLQGASGMCKAALPAHAAAARYRPLGLSNESGANMFVSCNWQGDDSQNAVRGARRVFVVISNHAAEARTVSCTLVNGFQSGNNLQATYTPKSISIPAGAGATLEWLPSEVSGAPSTIRLPAVSCTLPPQSTLQYTGKIYNEDVGA